MKKFSLLLLLAVSVQSLAGDILVLKDQSRFLGEVTKIKNCQVHYTIDEDQYKIPAADIAMIQFSDLDNPIYVKYKTQGGNCLLGASDAKNYQGKGGVHIALGALFGLFGTIGAAVATPTPHKGVRTLEHSENKELFNDAEYINCYKKKARGKNVGNTLIGWGAFLVVYIAATS